MKYKRIATCTPEELHRRLKAFLPIFRGLAAAVIADHADQAEFDAAVEDAMEILDSTPSASTCSELESLFGLMAILFVDAPLLESKPRDQVQVVIDEIEQMGTALSFVARTWHQYH
ncbi:hypothetical protein [Paraburkholderia guartelaensis]|uniref:hypothetical protein n=1 Tax=Paraburkholderia guartelaensis TaxID=2546446 RepID=UPI002AB64073|nr:hypothetical protein [Paraburkholderia guartelaensis]